MSDRGVEPLLASGLVLETTGTGREESERRLPALQEQC